jgi:hypothetical protein
VGHPQSEPVAARRAASASRRRMRESPIRQLRLPRSSPATTSAMASRSRSRAG